MKVTIDAIGLLGTAGGRSYISSLLRHLLFTDSTTDYFLLFRAPLNRAVKAEIASYARQVSFSRWFVPNRILEFIWTKQSINIPFTEILLKKPDIFFATVYFSPMLTQCKLVSVVYDITTMKYEAYADHRKMFDLRMKNTIERSRYLITISKYTKNALCEYYGILPENVIDVPLAPHIVPLVEQTADIQRIIRARYSLQEPYILYVGNIGPHKNLITLLNAFKNLKERKTVPHKLVLCGKTNWGSDVIAAAKELGLEESVIFTGYVPDEDLPAIYSGAQLFVFVSKYEGFGLPLVEAMGFGLPVICSNTTALPEVAGNAAFLVNPDDQEVIAEAMANVLCDNDLREKMSEASLARAAEFSWQKTALGTLEVFKKAAQ